MRNFFAPLRKMQMEAGTAAEEGTGSEPSNQQRKQHPKGQKSSLTSS
jgi:hypothetical protein